MYIVIDPPEGWKYGFPRAIKKSTWHDPAFDLEQVLRDAGYPEKDIHFATQHMRVWHQKEK